MPDIKIPIAVIEAAQAAQIKTGCPASVAIAQWAIESGWGRYTMHANNPFGMKWYHSCPHPFVVRRTQEYYNGKWTVVEAKFIHFPDFDTAFIAHGKLLMDPKGPYVAAHPYLKSNWEQFIRVMGAKYATDPHYADKLIMTIAANKLRQYDLLKH